MLIWVTEAPTWQDCPGGALLDRDDVAGVGNTEREEVIEDNDDFEENENTETELVAVERTEDPVAEAEELVETDEPVVEVAVAEVDVVELLQNVIVSHEDVTF